MVHLGFLGDGHNYHVQRWLPALAREGLDVTLFTFRPPTDPLPGVDIVRLRPPVASLVGRLSILDFWFAARQVRKALQSRRVDVLFASYATHYGWTGTLTGFHPMILQTWTFDVSTHPMQGWKRIVFRPQVTRALRSADVITTDGPALAEYVKDNYSGITADVIPVRWGIDTEEIDEWRTKSGVRNELGLTESDALVVSSRGLDSVYRPEIALAGLLKLLEERTDVHVVVLTLGHARNESIASLLKLISDHERGHVFDRFLSRDEMADLWNASDVVVSIPETDGISEGLLEAMYAGAIPVVSRIPSNESFITEAVNGYFVSGEDEDELVTRLSSIVDLPEPIKREVRSRNFEFVKTEASLAGTAALVAGIVRDLANSSFRDTT